MKGAGFWMQKEEVNVLATAIIRLQLLATVVVICVQFIQDLDSPNYECFRVKLNSLKDS